MDATDKVRSSLQRIRTEKFYNFQVWCTEKPCCSYSENHDNSTVTCVTNIFKDSERGHSPFSLTGLNNSWINCLSDCKFHKDACHI